MKSKALWIWVIMAVALVVFYVAAYGGHLSWQEQNQIFLNDADWIGGYLAHPAWLGLLSGDWLTQFYIYPVAGGIILSLAVTGCGVLFFRRIGDMLTPLAAWLLAALFAVVMVGCSLASATRLSFFMCVAGGLSLGMPVLPHGKGGERYADLAIVMALSYWAFGFGSLITGALIVLSALKEVGRRSGKRDWVIAVFAALMAFGFPGVMCRVYSLPYRKALLYPGVAKPTLPEMNLERHLRIADAFYHRDYPLTEKLASEIEKGDEFSAFYYYLASAMSDSLPDNLLKYPVKSLGTLTSIGEETPLPVINMMNDLYYELGDMTYAERGAMMRNVFSPGNRNVRMIRRLAEINLVSGDTLAAMKYLRILSRTHGYSGWSRSHMPGSMDATAESDIMRRRLFTNGKDNIRLGDNCRNILLELLESNPGNTVALDYLLCTDLLLKDIDTFKMDYDTYCMEKGKPRHKDLYQQALMIYLSGTGAPVGEWERYISSERQLELFNRYNDRRGDPSFAGTYWYYFDRQ